MPRSDAVTALASTAGATAIPRLETKSLYATDQGAARPLSSRFASRVHRTTRRIAVGQEERLPHGVLRCFAKDGRVVVEVARAASASAARCG